MLLFVEHMDLWVVCNYIHTLYTLIMHHGLLPRKRLASFVQSHAYIFGVSQIGNQPLGFQCLYYCSTLSHWLCQLNELLLI